MSDLIVDRRFVAEDEIEMRLAIRTTDRSLHVVGTRDGKLAFLDELDEIEPGADPAAYLASIADERYQRLVCQDPSDLGPVQTSGPVEGFKIVSGEEL